MIWFSNLKIRIKLILGFSVVALITAIVGLVGIADIKNVEQNDTEMYRLNTVPLDNIANVALAFLNNRIMLRDITIESDNRIKADYIDQIKRHDATISKELRQYEKTIRTAAGEKEIEKLKGLLEKYRPYREEIISLALSDQDVKAVALMRGNAGRLATEIEESIQTLINLKLDLARRKANSNTDTANHSVVVMLTFIVLGICIAVVLGLAIARLISRPIAQLVTVSEKLALGDVDVAVTGTGKDEIGRLMESFRKMIENIREQARTAEKIAAGDLTVTVAVRSENDLLGLKLKEMVDKNNDVLNNIHIAAQEVAAGAKQVSLSGQNLSQASTEQASSLEEITSSITEIAVQTKQNAVNANQANELAITIKDQAIAGNQQMKQMLQAMDEINDSSANISKIIKVIDEIAFQTNILALNAAVEAARAGQHGKGFAVVAEEVRNLAARSASAARETTELIAGSIKKADAGTKSANDTAAVLNQIVAGISNAANLIADIAVASNQQASAITQINQGIEQVSQVTQTNTATAEESASASEELASQAEVLKNLVARFQIRKYQALDQLKGASSEVLKALEQFLTQKNRGTETDIAAAEAAVTGLTVGKAKRKIDLDDADFGKY